MTRPPTEAASLLSYRAFDFCAAALTDVNHLNQAIGEFDRLACFRFHRFVFFCRHPAPTARTDHNWLFWARPHASEINTIKQTCQSGEIGQYQKARNRDTTHSLNSNRHRPFQNRTHGYDASAPGGDYSSPRSLLNPPDPPPLHGRDAGAPTPTKDPEGGHGGKCPLVGLAAIFDAHTDAHADGRGVSAC
jgi:hypothetical protein